MTGPSLFWRSRAEGLFKHRSRKHDVYGRAKMLRKVMRARRLRSDFFDSRLFSDPCWELLLELYNASASKRRLSMGALCKAANVAAATAMRRLNQLISLDLVRRVKDPNLSRRIVIIELTERGVGAMEAYLDRLAGFSGHCLAGRR